MDLNSKLVSDWVRCCQKCPLVRSVKALKPIRQRSKKAEKRIQGWPVFRAQIFLAHKGICYWCSRFCPLNEGTAEHLIPQSKTHHDVETECAWVHHWPFPRSCHGAKSGMGVKGQVIGMRWNVKRYGFDLDVPWLTAMEVAVKDPAWACERAELWNMLQQAQRDIDAGRKPSLLPTEEEARNLIQEKKQ
jgi:hypothetical protein